MLACQRSPLAPKQLPAVVSAHSDALVCESPKRWRIAFAHFGLTPDGLQHRGKSSTNRGKRTPNRCLMLKNLKPSTPLSRKAHTNRQLPLFVVFSWPSVRRFAATARFSCPTREKRHRTCVVEVRRGSRGEGEIRSGARQLTRVFWDLRVFH